ncbi:MAG: tRNA dimethylallyltransferase [Patescibacteria group bacterium]|nr:tRNA dimethylallyltransferase [Patescibacteria group bacterium]
MPYYLIDIVSPKTQFSLLKYQKLAYKAIDNILARGKLPIIVGGTGLYLQAIVDGYELSKVKPDKKLREKLEKLDADELFKKLQGLNKKFAGRLNKSEKKNKRRLIRYIEICKPKNSECLAEHSVSGAKYDFLLIGLIWPKEILRERIYKRLVERLEKEDMIKEVENLHKKQKVSWKRLKNFGLEYKYVALYLRKKLVYNEMVEKLNIAIRQFAKRQMSWFRRWERQGIKICWVKDRREAEGVVRKFLKRK